MYAFDIMWYIYYDCVSLSLISETKDAVSPSIIPECWNHDVKQECTDKLNQLGIRIRESCEKRIQMMQIALPIIVFKLW